MLYIQDIKYAYFYWDNVYLWYKGYMLHKHIQIDHFPDGSDGKDSASNVGHLGSIPRLGRFPGGGDGNPLQYSCLKNPMDRGAWWATVMGLQSDMTEQLSIAQNIYRSAGRWMGRQMK